MNEPLSIKVEVMAKDIQYLKDEVGEIKQMLKDHSIEERQVWEKLMAKKADIWVENTLKWAIYLVAGVFIAGIVIIVLENGHLIANHISVQ
jgi:Flp pilus assembly CpaF family ATPase